MDRGEGQHWNRAPGNLYSTPATLTVDPSKKARIKITLDQAIPPIEPPEDTEYVKHVQIESELLSEFWGRPMHLGAHVLLPEGFDEHPEARYPLVIFHGHFPSDFGGFRPEPPDPDLECEYSERFGVECYNRIQQQEAHDFYKTWTGPDFPRLLIVEVQLANPYYDDSYAVNSANLGPYGDAITHELVPTIEERFRGIGEGWARFLYGGAAGGGPDQLALLKGQSSASACMLASSSSAVETISKPPSLEICSVKEDWSKQRAKILASGNLLDSHSAVRMLTPSKPQPRAKTGWVRASPISSWTRCQVPGCLRSASTTSWR